jgi:hypothetical protein
MAGGISAIVLGSETVKVLTHSTIRFSSFARRTRNLHGAGVVDLMDILDQRAKDDYMLRSDADRGPSG